MRLRTIALTASTGLFATAAFAGGWGNASSTAPAVSGTSTEAMAITSMSPIMALKTSKGEILTDSKGMTLYTFDHDNKGVSNCNGDCAEYWPPMLAKAGAKATGKFTLVKRKDGKEQWAYRGMPLYLWQNDAKPGDTTGDNFKGVWHIVKY